MFFGNFQTAIIGVADLEVVWLAMEQIPYIFFLPLHTGSCPIYGRAPAPPQGYRCCAGAYPTPV